MLKIMKYLKPYKWYAIGAVVLMLINSGLGLALPTLMASMINKGIANGDLSYIYRMGGLMLGASALAAGASILMSYCSSMASTGFGTRLRQAVFYQVENLAQGDIDKIGTPSLITRSTNDIRQVQDMLLISLRIIISAPIMMVGGAAMAFMMNPTLAMVIFIVIPIIAVVAWIITKKVLPLFDDQQRKTDRLNKIVREKLSGMRVIRAFNRTAYEDERFRGGNYELTGIVLKINRIFAVLMPASMLLLYGTIIALVWIGAKQVGRMDLETQATEIASTVGNLQAFMLYLIMIIGAVGMAGAMFVMIPRARISVDRINEVMALRPEIREREDTRLPSEGCIGSLVFDHVTFTYPGADKPVLEDVSFHVGKGETLAVVGATGCGKSTLVDLIPRFYDVDTGAILVDGIDVHDLPLRSLHDRIGLIPQKAFLFSGTIADNLRYGKADATEEEMWRALSIAQAESFVRKLPNGLDSLVSQNATNLSGGQKQRLAIARALIRQAEFYIFDDSFSALDFKTDAQLRGAIHTHLQDAALLIIAQRVGTILDADRILVLDQGKAVGLGTHRELLETCRVYREIAQSQLTKEELV